MGLTIEGFPSTCYDRTQETNILVKARYSSPLGTGLTPFTDRLEGHFSRRQ
ncbi:hypothetical protein [Streptomyces sp. NPDC091371]|uniref:hypothetical protein n=1 Tax=Streptomyces sp. NPDC091371 TaxID=3155303 RepID=UPI00343B8EA5